MLSQYPNEGTSRRNKQILLYAIECVTTEFRSKLIFLNASKINDPQNTRSCTHRNLLHDTINNFQCVQDLNCVFAECDSKHPEMSN